MAWTTTPTNALTDVRSSWIFQGRHGGAEHVWAIEQADRRLWVREGPVGQTERVTAYVVRTAAAAAELCERWRREKADDGWELVVSDEAAQEDDTAARMTVLELQKRLLAAIQHQDLDRVRYLLGRGALVEPPNWLDETGIAIASVELDAAAGQPLVEAAEIGNPRMVRLLLDAGARPERIRDVPPLWAAAGYGHREVVEVLLNAGTPVDQEAGDGGTPLIQAAFMGQLDMVRLLVARGADVHHVGRNGDDALFAAARNGQREVYDYLLPLSREERRERAAALLAEGEARRARASQAHPKAHEVFGAIVDDDLPALHRLLKSGVPTGAADADGTLPLHHAAAAGRNDFVDALLLAGAEADARDPRGRTALMMAVEALLPSTTGLLLNAGADPTATDSNGTSARGIAAELRELGGADAELVEEIFNLLH